MSRRNFLLGIGTVAVWFNSARAQQASKLARIGFLGAASAAAYSRQVEGFRMGLRDAGYVEGRDIFIDYRWAEGNYALLPELVADLISANVDVIVTHGTPASIAAKRATSTIPIVLGIVGDPVASGVVASIARPGGNITGQSFFNPELSAKRVELLKELMPQMKRVAVFTNSDNPMFGYNRQAMEMTARAYQMELIPFSARSPSEFESVFDRMKQERIEGVEIEDDGMLNANLKAIGDCALQRRILSAGNKEFPKAGGLIGYGVDFFATFRKAARAVDKILKGTKPADIPIEQATTFFTSVNLKTAGALNLTVPVSTLARADEVIE